MRTRKTLAKVAAYKTFTTLELALLAWFLTGSFSLAGTFGALHLTVTTITYAGFEHLFERVWVALTAVR